MYDNFRLFSILPAAGSGPKLSFTYGKDLSGSMQGAGGVGGLLAMSDVGGGSSTRHYIYANDGNGNVAGLVNATNGILAAQYEYDPFGSVLRATGSSSLTNVMRFSSKMQDLESGWSYFGARIYSASLGRWISRDPSMELDGPNVYNFVKNQPAKGVDINGRQAFELWDPARSPRPWYVPPPTPPPPQIEAFYDVDPFEFLDWLAEPSGTVWANNLQEVIRDLQAKTRSGCCVKKLTFTAHNGNPGMLPLGADDVITSDSLNFRNSVLSNPKSSQTSKDLVNRTQNNLLGLKPYLCKPATIDFVMCQSGAGPGGQSVLDYLKQLFGPDVKIILHPCDTKWSYGSYIELPPPPPAQPPAYPPFRMLPLGF